MDLYPHPLLQGVQASAHLVGGVLAGICTHNNPPGFVLHTVSRYHLQNLASCLFVLFLYLRDVHQRLVAIESASHVTEYEHQALAKQPLHYKTAVSTLWCPLMISRLRSFFCRAMLNFLGACGACGSAAGRKVSLCTSLIYGVTQLNDAAPQGPAIQQLNSFVFVLPLVQ